MPRPIGFHVRLGWSGWLSILLALGLILAVAAVVTVLLLGAFIVLLPIFVVGAVLYYLFPGLRYRRHDNAPDIIEGEYRIVDRRELEQDPSRREDQP